MSEAKNEYPPALGSVRTDLEIIKDKLMSLIELHLPEDLTDLIDSAEWEVQAAIHWVDEHAPNAALTGGVLAVPSNGVVGTLN
jgi:hypothetical protein